jgi:hypothetical protein
MNLIVKMGEKSKQDIPNFGLAKPYLRTGKKKEWLRIKIITIRILL